LSCSSAFTSALKQDRETKLGIYRGAGGTGDATADATSEALLIRDLAVDAQVDAEPASPKPQPVATGTVTV
jgi:hypothetical protein